MNRMDLEYIESLIQLMKEHGVVALELEEDGNRVNLQMSGGAAVPMMMPAAPVAPTAQPAPVAEGASSGTTVNSPMVGTFYSSPKPSDPPFVSVGARVHKGQVLCIIEAMKLMNELESDVDGVVAEILVDNANPVQFGQPLFRITPD